MKRCVIIIALLALCTSIYAQDAFRTRKYKGFADIGLSAAFMEGESTVTFALSTSHGYQINPYFFMGAGIGVGLTGGSANDKEVTVPVFGQTRVNFSSRRISPFLDFKGGYDVGDLKGGVLSPTLGISMPVSYHCAIDFGLSYTCKLCKYEYSSWYYTYSETSALHTISLDFGFEF